jgi:hypothetical protein
MSLSLSPLRLDLGVVEEMTEELDGALFLVTESVIEDETCVDVEAAWAVLAGFDGDEEADDDGEEAKSAADGETMAGGEEDDDAW